ncbi:hypothetical protein FRC11_013221, partial [Ceratobasidium sp. 423]
MSVAKESDDEEILYKPPPRKPTGRPSVSSISGKKLSGIYAHDRDGTGSLVDIIPIPIDVLTPSSASTGSTSPANGQQTYPKAGGRSSGELAMGQSGTSIPSTTGTSMTNPTAEREKDRKDKTSRRRSLGVGVSAKSDRTPGGGRPRGGSIGLSAASAMFPQTNTTSRRTASFVHPRVNAEQKPSPIPRRSLASSTTLAGIPTTGSRVSDIPFCPASPQPIQQVIQPIATSRRRQRDREGSMSPIPPTLACRSSSHSVTPMASRSRFSQSSYSIVSRPPSVLEKTGILKSLLKRWSSRKSMGGSGDKIDANKSSEKEKRTKEDKKQSDNHIMALTGRKNDETVSSADDGRRSKPVSLSPVQVSNPPATTVQPATNLNASSRPSLVTRPIFLSMSRSREFLARKIRKASGASLRSEQQHAPTITGSSFVGTGSRQPMELGGVSPMSKVTAGDALPTIPCSPRTSLNVAVVGASQQSERKDSKDTSPSLQSARRSSAPALPQSASRAPCPPSANLRTTKSQSSSSFWTAGPSAQKSVHPVPPRGPHKLSQNSTPPLDPKSNFSGNRVVNASSRSGQSLWTLSPMSREDEELVGDREMAAYIKRLYDRKLAVGVKREELDEMFKSPEPIPPQAGLTPAELLASPQSDHLCPYERKEVLDFERVYYVGQGSKKNMATLDNSTNNYGYDNERGDYLDTKHDHLAYRYEIIDILGVGSFAKVLECRDHRTGLSVGIKVIRNKERFHRQGLVEIKVLKNLKELDPEEKSHVLRMQDYFMFRNHLCIVTELLSINLFELIQVNEFAGFTIALIRRFTSQMLASLALMHQHRIVHCDLKPENVLLLHPAKSALKVIDFGSSCFEHEKVYTHIQSRFYRSPEIILGMNYHTAIDMWSLGCILAELYTGYPIFPGENEQEQLACIMEVLGVPDKDLINRSSRKQLFFDSNGQPRPVVNSKGRRRRPGSKTLAQVLRCDDEMFVDFIAKCLNWVPELRLKPWHALRHPFMTASHLPKITNSAPTVSSRHRVTPGASMPGVTTSSSPTVGSSRQRIATHKSSVKSDKVTMTVQVATHDDSSHSPEHWPKNGNQQTINFLFPAPQDSEKSAPTREFRNLDNPDMEPITGDKSNQALDSFTQTPQELEQSDPLIGKAMSAKEIIAQLVYYGCKDLTECLDLDTFEPHPISCGGSSDIYRGKFLGEHNHIAVKALRVSMDNVGDGKHLKRAARELYTWNHCNHPNVHRFLGLAVFRDRIGMVSPWAKNGNLPQYLKNTPEADRHDFCVQISRGLLHLHGIGIVHGDLKAVNVLVLDDGTPALTDFDNSSFLVGALDFTTTTRQDHLTTRWALYQAPELLDGSGERSEAADIYALGMTMLEIMSGELPYAEKPDLAVMSLVQRGKHPERPEDNIPPSSRDGDKFWKLLL